MEYTPVVPSGARILLTGATGQVGRELSTRLGAVGSVVAVDRASVDFDKPASLRDLVDRVQPTIIVNAAAYTAVDAAESDRERCLRVNAVAPGILAESAAAIGAAIVHYSTNYVFDGNRTGPYTEADPISPVSVYGETKALGEQAVAAGNPAHVILRCSAIYSWTGKNFLLRILELADERDELRVVDDQLVSPTPAGLVAEGTMRVIERLLARADGTSVWGTFNLTTAGECSWYRLACEILALDPERNRRRCGRVLPVTSSEYVTPARRPPNGVLDPSLFVERFGHRLPSWQDALRNVFAQRTPHV